MPLVKIINTGVANIRSLQAAFERNECDWELTRSANDVVHSEYCVLPGVGTFAAGMAMLEEFRLIDAIGERIANDRPTLAVCLGLQLLCQSSEEQSEGNGLGIVPGHVQRFPAKIPTPQLGWNDVKPNSEGYFGTGQAYFANSYRLQTPPDGWSWAATDYGGPFVSSFWKGRVLACQFHPELSGDWGNRLLKNWVDGRTVSC